MNQQEQISQAIQHLGTQRAVLGDAVVDATIAALYKQLAELEPAPAAEQRKLVTVLFVDIVDWTVIGQQLDPEDLSLIQAAYFGAVKSAIANYGGTVEKYIGDAVMAVFGVPIAHEDDAIRAVLAALAIQQALTGTRGLEIRPGEPLHIRVGLHTGMVMANTRADSRDLLVTGDAVNVASRLQAAAKPGTVVVSQDTWRLVAGAFRAEALPPLPVKGVAEPLITFRIVGVRPSTPNSRTVGGLISPLVGRQEELAVLEGAIAQLASGRGAVAAVIGDAGVGKSRLIAEAFKGSAASQVQSVAGRCLSYGNAIPYHLWLDVLQSAAHIPADAPHEIADAHLRAWVERNCPSDCDDLYRSLAQLLALTTIANWTPRSAGPAESRLSKATIFRAVETLVRRQSAAQPLAIICEDLQWADPSSVELLEHLAKLTEEIPLLLICAFRPEATQPIWPLLGRLSAASQRPHINLWLHPLSVADSERMVANLLDGGPAGGEPASPLATARSQRLLWRVLGRAEGNPFFLEEAIRSLIQRGALTQAGAPGQWRLRADSDELTIPETVQSVLGARIDSLQHAARRVLQVAAVVGRDFSLPVLAEVLPGETELPALMAALLDQGFVAECPDPPEYRFNHALVHEVAYHSLLRSERRRYHREVALALEGKYQGSDKNVETLALHWRRGGDLARAAGYYAQSGDRARSLGASLEATNFFQTALDLLGGVADSPASLDPAALHERLGDVYLENLSAQDQALVHYSGFAGGAATPIDKARGARKLASTYMLEGDLVRAQVHFEEALRLLAGLPADPEANRVRCGLAYLAISRGDLSQAGVHVRLSIGLARSIGDPRGLADAYRLRGIIADSQGNPRLSLAYARRCLRLYQELRDLPQLAQAHNNVAVGCRQLGFHRQAKRHLQTGLDIALRIGDIRDQALLLLSQAELLLDQGLAEQAIDGLLEALPLAQSSGAVTRLIQTHHILGAAYHQSGRLDDAQRSVEAALSLCQETRHHRYHAALLLDLAHLAVSQGEEERCLQLIGLVEEMAGPTLPAPIAREALRGRGRLALRQEQWGRAVEALQASLAADRREPVASRASGLVLLARALAGRQQPGDDDQARQCLREAEITFRRIGNKSRRADARALLRRLGSTRAAQIDLASQRTGGQ